MKFASMIKALFILFVGGVILNQQPAFAEQNILKQMRNPASYTKELGSKTIAVTGIPDLMEYHRTYSPYGLTFQTAYLVTYVADDSGQKYNLMRTFSTTNTGMVAHSMQEPGLDAQSKPLFDPSELFLGRLFYEKDPQNDFILVRPFRADSRAFSITIRPQQALWKDADGRIDLAFKAVGPALEFYTPGKLESAFYRSEPMSVTGTVNGKSVKGFGVFDFSYGPAGVSFVQGKIYKVLEKAWSTWFNVYDDGSTECGIFVYGLDEFQAFYYNKDGKARITHHNTCKISHTPDGYLEKAEYTADEMKFRFETEARQAQVATALVSWAEGRMVNLSENKKPVQTLGVIEFFRGDVK